jgi:hypothetical protein
VAAVTGVEAEDFTGVVADSMEGAEGFMAAA